MTDNNTFMKEKTYILAIDTTEERTGIGLTAAGPEGTLARRGKGMTRIKTWLSQRNQSQELLPNIDNLLKTNKIKPEQLKWVAVNLGPGSFTGLRVGISTANAFGYGLQIPVIGQSHLTGVVKDRLQQLLEIKNPTQPPLSKGRSKEVKKFRQVLPVYGSAPRITQP